MTVWPSLAATAPGRLFGRLYAIDYGPRPFTVGHLVAVASIPFIVSLYFGRFVAELVGALPIGGRLLAWFLPPPAQRYVLTNRRVVAAGLRNQLLPLLFVVLYSH